MISKALLYFHTIRHLTLQQIYFQIFYRVYKPKPRLIKFLPKRRDRKKLSLKFISKSESLINSQEFKFFDEKGQLKQIGWSGNEKSKLWRYHQHYFDDLNSHNANLKNDWHHDLINNWIFYHSHNTSLGWDPYPTSLRVVNWIKWDLDGNNLTQEHQKSLYSHGLLLERKIEFHISGNHLIANAKALLFLGLYFSGNDADRWFSKGLKILSHEIKVQVLSDGGNYELSPMYHCIFLEDLLDLINFSALPYFDKSKKLEDLLSPYIEPMLNWMHLMSHNENELSCFNDSANNISASPKMLKKYSNDLGFITPKISPRSLSCHHLKESGYIVVYNKYFKTILDVAKLGPDHLLAHGHADTLSFEMAIDGIPIFVNSGTSTYAICERRSFERSTQAHNTLEINNISSSQVWSSFRVARRAEPRNTTISSSTQKIEICASHNGYQYLAGSPTHSRKWLIKDTSFIIEDQIDEINYSAISRFILDAGITIRRLNNNEIELETPSHRQLRFKILIGKLKICAWQHTNSFGSLRPTNCIEVSAVDGKSRIEVIQ